MTHEPSGDELPPDLRAFLHSCIQTIVDVDLLMMMRGSQGVRTARDVAEELRLPPAAARRALETLAARGLLTVQVSEETAYRYAPKSEDLARYCDVLAQYYITSRHAVLAFVAESRPSIKRFADAFKLRGPEGER